MYKRKRVESEDAGCDSKVLVRLPKSLRDTINSFVSEVNGLTGMKSISASLVFREGSKLFMEQLRVQLRKAKKGRLHAKVRKDIIIG